MNAKEKNCIIVSDYNYNNVKLNLEEPHVKIFINYFTYFKMNNIEAGWNFFQLYPRIQNIYEKFKDFDLD